MEEQYEGKELVGTLKGNSQPSPINWEFDPATAHQFTQQIPTYTGATTHLYAAQMTLRDHFAGLAMQALIGKYDEGYARDAYKIADDMLAEREKQK